MAKSKSLSTDEKRELIYVSERLKALASELATLADERATLEAIESPEEEEKRRRIYLAMHQELLQKERADTLEKHKELSALV